MIQFTMLLTVTVVYLIR